MRTILFLFALLNSIAYSQTYTKWQFSNYTVGNQQGNEFSGTSVMMPEIMLTDSGHYRMFYNVNNGPDSCSYIKYAESSDGVSWDVKGIALDGINDTLDPNYWSGGARIVQLMNGNYRMFYRTTRYVGNGQPLYHTRSAISTDGEYFVRESDIRINIHEYDTTSIFQTAAHGAFFKTDNGLFIAIFTASLVSDPIYGEPSDLYIATSFDEGISWGSFFKLYDDCHDPVVVKRDSIYYLFAALEDYAFVTAQSTDGIMWPATLDTLYFTDSLNVDLSDSVSGDLGAVVNVNNEIEIYSNYGIPSENIGRFFSTNPPLSSVSFIATEPSLFSLFPNPVSDYLNISLYGAKIRSNDCKIYNSKGDLVGKELVKSNSNTNLPIGSLTSGVYFIEIDNTRIPFVKKN